MGPTRLAILAIGSVAGALTPAVAQHSIALGQAQPGLWEISGAPDARAPVRQCLADLVALAEFEHRGRNCAPKVISSSASSMVIGYSCGSGDFGRSQVDVITPRSLRIATQGISHQLPFNYVLQARRIGDCPARAPAPRH